MSNQETETQPLPEKGGAGFKVYHFGEVDAVIPKVNLDEASLHTMASFAERLGQNDQSDFRFVEGHLDAKNRHFYFGSTPDGPLFFKRMKASGKDDPTRESFLALRQYDNEQSSQIDEISNRRKKALNAAHSLMSELEISPKVTEVIRSEKIQRLGQQFGFSSISFSEPIFGVVERKSQNKYMAYQGLADAKTVTEIRNAARKQLDGYEQMDKALDLIAKINEIAPKLKQSLVEAGIYPHDFGPLQLLYDLDSNTLYLIDAESWFEN